MGMRQGNQIDLRTQAGLKSVVVTPGNSVQYVYNPQQSKIGAGGGSGGLWNCVRGRMITMQMTIVRTGSPTLLIYADEFYRAISSIQENCPMFGTLLDPTFVDGQVAKWILEFIGLAYNTAGINRLPVAAAAGTYVLQFELYIPFVQKYNIEPDQFDMWLGWLNDNILEIFVSGSSNPFGTGDTTITSMTFAAGLDMVPWPELMIPPYVVLRRYEQTAGASSTGPILVNVGSAGALQGVDDASRLVAMLFSHQVGGFTGSGLENDIQQITLGWRDQLATTNISQLLLRWLNTTHRRHRLGTLAARDNFDDAMPYTMQGGPPLATNPLSTTNAFYTPLVWPEMDSLISYLQKIKGNYPLDIVFNTPQSNVFRTYTLEHKQFALPKASEMVAAAGIDPTKVMLVPKYGKKNVKKVDASKLWGLPRSIIGKGG